jgi:uncharacterized protein YecT (DUF1311 family)
MVSIATCFQKPRANRKLLRKSELPRDAWIAYRDAYIEAMYPADKRAEYGSMYPLEADLLRAKLTQQQVAALSEMLQQYSN